MCAPRSRRPATSSRRPSRITPVPASSQAGSTAWDQTMNTLAKLSAYGAALALLAVGAYATGSAVGPLDRTATARSVSAGSLGAEGAGHGDTHSGAVPEAANQPDQPAGLASSRGGYTLTPTASTLTAETTDDLALRITGPDGATVTAFDEEHTKRLHLIVVRRDTTGFQHLHPTMDTDGIWRARVDVPAAASTGPSPTSPRPAVRRPRSGLTCPQRARTTPSSTPPVGRPGSTATRSGSTATSPPGRPPGSRSP